MGTVSIAGCGQATAQAGCPWTPVRNWRGETEEKFPGALPQKPRITRTVSREISDTDGRSRTGVDRRGICSFMNLNGLLFEMTKKYRQIVPLTKNFPLY